MNRLVMMKFTDDEISTIEFVLNNFLHSEVTNDFEMTEQVEVCEELLEKVRMM